MKKHERAKNIQVILNQYVPHPQIPIHFTDPFTLLITTLLSAQCTDARVNQVAPKLFAMAKTPRQMAKKTSQEVEAIIRPCGLAPTKSRAIVKLSQVIVQQYQGKVPHSLEELEQLPGVGHKTASVVVVHAFHEAAFPVDTHIHRCAKRWKLSSGKNVKETERDLKKLFPKKSWGRVHLQIILYARKYCPARGHIKDHCPICKAVLH
jgi:endonuclease III